MNKERRKSIERIVDKLNEIQADLAWVRNDEEEAYDNLPEGIQSSERGDSMEEAIDAMDNADGSLQEAIDYLEELI